MNILKVLTEKRQKGNFGEKAAARFLKKKGCKILERGFVGGKNEIDVIAMDKDAVIFAEVKTRNKDGDTKKEPRAASSVTPEKQRKIISASRYYLKKVPSGKKIRYDVIEVYTETVGKKLRVSEIKHLVNTFDLDTAYNKR